jgi:hypothetical protein
LERTIKHYGGEGIVVVVKVERNRLEADENVFAPIERNKYQSDEVLYISLCLVNVNTGGEYHHNK